jgi:thiol-disulfide isomerase/thioredoxin
MKNNKQELKVILSKVAWCGHCTNFLPVFNKSQKLTKNNKYLKDTNVNFEVYDMEEDLAKFKSNNYEDLLPQINGYPTVIVTSLKNGKRVNAEIINHSSDPLEFINTVGETYNKLVSQSGGYEEEEFYKQKYLKYKSKYAELKGYKFNINSKQKGGLKGIEAYGSEPPTAEELFFIDKDNIELLNNII